MMFRKTQICRLTRLGGLEAKMKHIRKPIIELVLIHLTSALGGRTGIIYIKRAIRRHRLSAKRLFAEWNSIATLFVRIKR